MAAESSAAAQRDQEAVSGSTRTVHPVTLRFADPSCERAYQSRLNLLHAANDSWVHKMHVVVAILHLYITAVRLDGSVLTPRSARIMLPYSIAAVAHLVLARTVFYNRHRTACLLAFEAVYSVICLGKQGLPLWVLVEATDLRVSAVWCLFMV